MKIVKFLYASKQIHPDRHPWHKSKIGKNNVHLDDLKKLKHFDQIQYTPNMIPYYIPMALKMIPCIFENPRCFIDIFGDL